MVAWKYAGYSVLGNTVNDYISAALLFIATWAALRLLTYVSEHYLDRVAGKSSTRFDDALLDAITVLDPTFYGFIALYVAVQALTVPARAATILSAVTLIVVTIYAVRAASRLIDHAVRHSGEDETESSLHLVLGRIVKGVFWVIAFLFVLSNLGVKITTFVASLGVGGIAVAFALQNILGDIFASFSIYFDRPFEVGDFIIVGGDMGTVQHIGLKSTRLETLRGEELVLSNKELTETRVNNFKKMEKRRAEFTFGVKYETDADLVESIPDIVREIVDDVELAELDRVHFKNFADSALQFEVVYYVSSKEYNDYMDTQQAINLELLKRFRDKGIEFAYPTRTIHMEE